ncbi:hypothetical protein C8Q76DRAFT_692724 [Earliella scabrosa]|nr:hypothetical protein C8Q76DRAFT_692724 [Earliella scabrosa]
MNGSMRACHLASDSLLCLSAQCHVGLCGVAKTRSDHESLPVPWLRFAKLEHEGRPHHAFFGVVVEDVRTIRSRQHTATFRRDNSHQLAGSGVDDTAPVTSTPHDDVPRPQIKMMEVVETSTEPRREPTHIVKTEAASAPSIKVERPSAEPGVGSAGGPPGPQEESSGSSSSIGGPSLQLSGNRNASAPAQEAEAGPGAAVNMATGEVAVDDDKEAGAETALDAMIEDSNKAPKLAIIESCGLDSLGPDTRADSLPSEPQPESDGEVARKLKVQVQTPFSAG